MSSIRNSITSGVFYTAIAKYSNVFFSIIIGAILARLLTPKEFGIVALVTVFVTFFNLLGDFGIGKAVVQNQKLTKYDIQSIFSFSIILSLLLGTLFFFTAPVIAKFYGDTELINISRLLALSVFFHSLQAIPKALLEKALKFKNIGLITIIIQLITGVIAIILAYKGYSYYALVIRSILNGLLLFFTFYLVSYIKIVIKIDINAIKKIIRFTVFNFSFNFINYFSRNGDNLIVGKFLGTTSLGFYDKAYKLMMLPVHNLTHVITPVMLPIFAKHQGDKNIVFNAYLKIVKILASIGFPLSVFLFFSAFEIINIMYGAQWNQSIPIFKIIALIVGIQLIYSTAGAVFLAINRAELLFYYGLISSFILISCILLGVFLGKSLEAVAYGIVTAFTVNFFIVFYMLIHVALNKSILVFLKTLLYPVFMSLVMVLPLWVYSRFEIDNIFLNLGLKLAISGLTFAFIFFCKKENRDIVEKGIKQYINK